MSLRDYLEQRERELVAELNSLYGQITPKEAELSEVRRAKAAIGMGNELVGGTGLAAALSGGFGSLPGSTPVPSGLAAPFNNLLFPPSPLVNTSTFGQITIEEIPKSPYAHLTMKELVVKVLREHFPDGATTRQMLDFFRDAWGRDIERTSLSPQLSRLVGERIIGRVANGIWVLLRGPDDPRAMPDTYPPTNHFVDREDD